MCRFYGYCRSLQKLSSESFTLNRSLYKSLSSSSNHPPHPRPRTALRRGNASDSSAESVEQPVGPSKCVDEPRNVFPLLARTGTERNPRGRGAAVGPGLVRTVCPSGPGWLGLKGTARAQHAGSPRPQQLPPELCPQGVNELVLSQGSLLPAPN